MIRRARNPELSTKLFGYEDQPWPSLHYSWPACHVLVRPHELHCIEMRQLYETHPIQNTLISSDDAASFAARLLNIL